MSTARDSDAPQQREAADISLAGQAAKRATADRPLVKSTVRASLLKLPIKRLRLMCAERNLRTTGTETDLVDRLLDNLRTASGYERNTWLEKDDKVANEYALANDDVPLEMLQEWYAQEALGKYRKGEDEVEKMWLKPKNTPAHLRKRLFQIYPHVPRLWTFNDWELRQLKDVFSRGTSADRAEPIRKPKRRVDVRPALPRVSSEMQTLFSRKQSPSIPRNARLLHRNPNIYVIDDFLSAKQLEYLDLQVHLNTITKRFVASEVDDGIGVNEAQRTSTFIHFPKGGDSYVREIEQQAAQLVGLKVENVEPLQVVSYTGDQSFGVHHDSGTLVEADGEQDTQVKLTAPYRLVTFFVYLTDMPHGGGETVFPRLIGPTGGPLAIRPVRGRKPR